MKNTSILPNILPNGNLEIVFLLDGVVSAYLIEKDAISNFQNFYQEKQVSSY